MSYIGRFAPTPSGNMHYGSLFTALASFLDARANNGKWLLRIDDIDQSRTNTSFIDSILATLVNHGLKWDDSVTYQSKRNKIYEDAASQLAKTSSIRSSSVDARKENQIDNQLRLYDSTDILKIKQCNHRKLSQESKGTFVSQKIDNLYFDCIQGYYRIDPVKEHKSNTIRHGDGTFTYFFGTIIDDYLAGVNNVVRGCDLLSLTPLQISLQETLGFNNPFYKHLPILVDCKTHSKLSKQNGSRCVNTDHPSKNLIATLHLLKQNPPKELTSKSVDLIINWAISNWTISSLTNIKSIPFTEIP